MTFDRRILVSALVIASLPSLAAAAEGRTPAEHRRLAQQAARLREAAPAGNGGYAGQLGSYLVDANGLLAAMGIDPAIVVSPVLAGDPRQAGVFPGLGMLSPTEGANFAWLSSGIAGAGTAQAVDPASSGTQPGYINGSTLVTDCPPADDNDCIELSFSFNVPSGMNSIRFDFNFLSSEFPEWVGTSFNDAFTVSLSSPSYNYANIVFDINGNPITINSAFFNQPCTSLVGTGFDIDDFFGDCDAGATGLLTTEAPVAPGETVSLVFRLYDVFDAQYDSAVLLDNFVLSDEIVDGPSTNGQVVIDYLTPKSGPLAGGTSVLIHGEGFENVQAVAFGGIPALYNVLDETTIQAITPPHSEGPVDVSVTAQPSNVASTGVKPNGYIYYVSPEGSPLQVLSVDPPEGPSHGGVNVAIRGSGFKADTVITFDGEAVESQEFINGDEIVVVTPAGSGTADIRATNPDGTNAELAGGYVYIGNGASGNGTRGALNKGCSCSLESTGAPASAAAAPVAIAGLVFAAWLVRRRSLDLRKAALVAAVPAALVSAGCNDSSLAPVNSAPIADAGPSSEAFIGETVTLDGTESRDFESGGDLEFQWEIVTKPEGSVVELDDPSEKTPSFTPDLAGLYRIGLVVVDADGVDSGPIGYGGTDDDNLTDVVALPYRDLRVTLTWDEADSDLDLHLVRPNVAPNGGYFNQDHDCFYGSPDPEWGSVGIESDNPLLALDVETGMGPEEIVVPSPQDNGTYAILVHVFDQHGAAPTNARVVLSIEGQDVADVVSVAPLSSTDTVWRVGTLQWPENVFTEQNSFTTHSALGGPAH